MLKGHLDKEPTKTELEKKTEAWKTLNSVLVKTQSEFMGKLQGLLLEKRVKLEELKAKLERGEGSEDDNAEYLFTGGYVQCLKDILGVKSE